VQKGNVEQKNIYLGKCQLLKLHLLNNKFSKYFRAVDVRAVGTNELILLNCSNIDYSNYIQHMRQQNCRTLMAAKFNF
jgi:hypothetical protein